MKRRKKTDAASYRSGARAMRLLVAREVRHLMRTHGSARVKRACETFLGFLRGLPEPRP